MGIFLFLTIAGYMVGHLDRTYCPTDRSFKSSLYRSKVCNNEVFPLGVEEYDRAVSGSALRGK